MRGRLAVAAQRIPADSVGNFMEESAAEKRALAERYRRLAVWISDPSVAQQLNLAAEKLEHEAHENDRQGDGTQKTQDAN